MSPRAASMALQGEETRAAALAAAIDLFGEFGYRGCSLAQIASRAGIVQSGLHHHFGTKEKLLLEALVEHYPVSVTRPDIEAIARGEVDFATEIVRVTRSNVRDPHLIRFFSVMTGESLTDGHPAAEFFIERYARLRTSFANAIAESLNVSDSPVATARIELIVTTTFGGMDGLQMQWLRDDSVDLIAGVELLGEMARQQLELVRLI